MSNCPGLRNKAFAAPASFFCDSFAILVRFLLRFQLRFHFLPGMGVERDHNRGPNLDKARIQIGAALQLVQLCTESSIVFNTHLSDSGSPNCPTRMFQIQRMHCILHASQQLGK